MKKIFFILLFFGLIFSNNVKSNEEINLNEDIKSNQIEKQEVINDNEKPAEISPHIKEETKNKPIIPEENNKINNNMEPEKQKEEIEEAQPIEEKEKPTEIKPHVENKTEDKPVIKSERKNIQENNKIKEEKPESAENVKKENEDINLPQIEDNEIEKFEDTVPEKQKSERKNIIIKGAISILLVISGMSMLIILIINFFNTKTKINNKQENDNMPNNDNNSLKEDFEDITKD